MTKQGRPENDADREAMIRGAVQRARASGVRMVTRAWSLMMGGNGWATGAIANCCCPLSALLLGRLNVRGCPVGATSWNYGPDAIPFMRDDLIYLLDVDEAWLAEFVMGVDDVPSARPPGGTSAYLLGVKIRQDLDRGAL